MQNGAGQARGWNSKPWRVAAWTTAAALMLVPVMVQVTHGNFGWTFADFVFVAFGLLFSCSLFDLAARRAPSFAYLAGAGAGLAAGFGLLFVNGAVGLVGSEDEVHNLYFFVVLAVAIFGSVAARGRPARMSLAMAAAAITHIVISTAILIGVDGRSDGDPLVEVIGLSIFAMVWLASAWLFRSALKQC